MINEMIQNANLTNVPVVLNSIWTENEDFGCSLMGDEMMITDMVECQDLIAALSVAEDLGVAIPKLKAEADPDAYEINGWHAVNVDIMGPVTNSFMQILIDIQNGELNFKQKVKKDSLTIIRNDESMTPFILCLEDNINIINATQNI